MVVTSHTRGRRYIPLLKTHTEPDETFNPLPALHIPQATVVLRKCLCLSSDCRVEWLRYGCALLRLHTFPVAITDSEAVMSTIREAGFGWERV